MEPLRFIVDTQLPPILAAYLCRKGFDSIHTTHFDEGHLLPDRTIRDIALQERRIIITKDSDFPELFYKQGAPPQVLYLMLGSIRNNDLIDWLDRHLTTIVALFGEGAEMITADRTQLISY